MIKRQPLSGSPEKISWLAAQQEIAQGVSTKRYLEIMLAVALDDKARREFLNDLKQPQARHN